MDLAKLCGVTLETGTRLRLPEPALAELRLMSSRFRPPPRLEPPTFVRPVPIDPTGEQGPTRGQSRGPGWRWTSPNRYVVTDAVFDQPAQRIVEAADRLTASGGVTGWASLHLAGARWFDGSRADGSELPVALALGARGQRVDVASVVTHRQRVDPAEVVRRHGIRCLGDFRSVLDEMSRAPDVREAGVVLEMALFAELFSLRQFENYVAALSHRRHLDPVRAAIENAVEGAESPPEVRMRQAWELDAGFDRPVANRNVYSLEGRFLGRPDLLDPVSGTVGEYEGAHHLENAARRKDLAREELMRRHGLGYYTVVGGELSDRDLVVDRMGSARQRALAHPGPRRWTLDPPPWEKPQLTLDQRLAVRAWILAEAEVVPDNPAGPTDVV